MSLDTELAYYNVLATLLRKARDIASASPYDRRVQDLGLPALGKTRNERAAALDEHFDEMEKVLTDSFLLRLVAAFEAAAFDRLSTCVGEARKAVEENMPPTTPFHRAASRLVRDANDITTLAHIEELCRAYPRVALDSLKELRDHRNWVAHGGRAGGQSTFTGMAEVHRVLSETLAELVGAPE